MNGGVKREPVGRSYGGISLSPREELIVFAYQIWKPLFLSVVQFPFDNCHSPFSPTTFFEIGVYMMNTWNSCIWTADWNNFGVNHPLSYKRYLSSSERENWKIQTRTGLQRWPLRCPCSALPVELVGQLEQVVIWVRDKPGDSECKYVFIKNWTKDVRFLAFS